ncbi:MAG: exo-beta-N-acetylmuramidase NamZ family protein [bacterium]
MLINPVFSNPRIKLGIEVLLEENIKLIKGKRIGLITNQTGVDSHLRTDIDLLSVIPDIRLMALFGPEHGIDGSIPRGTYVKSYIDKETGIPVYSLYGDTRKPTKDMLKDIDVLLFDIQDVGTRYYTYIYTMALAMESAKENGIDFVVLDRPNPLNGISVEGPVLEPPFSSFIGMYPIPLRHGMTIGELAQLFNKEFKIGARLTVVPMKNWTRDMWFDDTGLNWVISSPNIPDFESVLLYPCTGPIGDTNISVGIGTTKPFHFVGAPYIDSSMLLKELNKKSLPGILFRKAHFIPQFDRYEKEVCNGVEFFITDRKAFKPIETCLTIIEIIHRLYPDRFNWGDKSGGRYFFDLSMGTDKVRLSIERGLSVKEIVNLWTKGLERFISLREGYLLYR